LKRREARAESRFRRANKQQRASSTFYFIPRSTITDWQQLGFERRGATSKISGDSVGVKLLRRRSRARVESDSSAGLFFFFFFFLIFEFKSKHSKGTFISPAQHASCGAYINCEDRNRTPSNTHLVRVGHNKDPLADAP